MQVKLAEIRSSPSCNASSADVVPPEEVCSLHIASTARGAIATGCSRRGLVFDCATVMAGESRRWVWIGLMFGLVLSGTAGIVNQVLWQRAPCRLTHIVTDYRCRRCSVIRLGEGLLLLQILQGQFELGDGGGQSLRGTAEVHPP